MKHAVLIMAHKNKDQVIRLIKSLESESFDFYVHCDSAWCLSDSDLADIKNCSNNVFIATKRIHGILDNWSLPQITLNLIDDALDNEKSKNVVYSYFLLLSGQDYPIKIKNYILDFLEKQYPTPLIHVDSYKDEHWVRTKFMPVRWMHKIDDLHIKMKPGILRKLCVAPYAIAEKIEQKFYVTPFERISKYGIKLYGGSAWWILPHGVIDYINRSRKENPRLIKEYKRTWTPEETFFQTMTMNSPYAEYLANGYPPIYDTEPGDQPCMTYANFITPTKPFRGHPHIITLEDFERIMSKKALFARKFDMNIDSKVIDMIDKMINNV